MHTVYNHEYDISSVCLRECANIILNIFKKQRLNSEVEDLRFNNSNFKNNSNY